MNDKILQQLEILANNGVHVKLVTASYFQVSGFDTWFGVDTKNKVTKDSGRHADEPFTNNTHAECLVKRFHAYWRSRNEHNNTYVYPPTGWVTLFRQYNLPYRLSII